VIVSIGLLWGAHTVSVAYAQGLEPIEAVPPAGLDGTAASCAPCHAEQVDEWRQSRHSVSATNPIFTAAWRRWPAGWCVNCHAPIAAEQRSILGHEAQPGATYPPNAWIDSGSDGVSCAACHLRDGVILTSRAATAAADAVHPTRVDPALVDGRACATCHDFSFQNHTPALPFTLGPTPAQSTTAEWAGSAAAARGERCVDCHLGASGHTFPGAHSPELVRSLVRVEAVREGDAIRWTVSAPGNPHKFPTGDPVRHVDLDLCADPACDQVVARATLRRTLAVTASTWTIESDTTIPPQTGDETPSRSFVLPAAGASAWRLWYGYADRRDEPSLPSEEVGFVITGGPVPTR
jgi:hypothetical protein